MKIDVEDELGLAIYKLEHTAQNLAFDQTSFPCPQCHTRVHFPIVARKYQIEYMEDLIKVADKYLWDNGGASAMLKEVIETCINNLRKKHLKVVK